MLLVFLVLLFVIFECASIEIAGAFGVPITLKLNKSSGARRGKEGSGTYPHGPLDDGDDIV